MSRFFPNLRANKIPIDMQKWSDDLLNRMRMTGDELADSATREILKNKTQEERNDAIGNIVRHPYLNKEKFPELKPYFSKVEEQVFSEEDVKAFDRSVEIFNEHGFRIFLLLFFKSLPTGYMAPKPGHVLATTKLLEEYATRRVFETAIYIMSVMKEGWYKGEKKGLRMLEKLRFIHSSMRVQILEFGSVKNQALDENEEPKQWDKEYFGVPINQEDEVLTLQLFSLAVIRGLKEMGITLSKDDQNAWFHAWRRIGRILGIKEELEPKTLKDAWRLQNRIYGRQFKMPNPDGPPLTRALLEVMEKLSGNRIKLEALEKITRYFLFATHGKSLKYVQKSLGMDSKASYSELIIDTIIYYLVNWDLWDKLFHRKRGASFFTKMIRRMLAKRLGLEHLHKDENETQEVLDTMIKGMLSELSKKTAAKEVHNRAFEIEQKQFENWDLGGWEMEDGL
jgi:hypothetical protein